MKRTVTIGFATVVAALSATTSAVAGVDAWNLPQCGNVTGDGSVTFTRNDGKTIASTSEVPHPITHTHGLVTLDRPNELLALSNNQLLSSVDAGCTWTRAGTVDGAYLMLTAARGGRAYAWDNRGGNLMLATSAGTTPLTSPTNDMIGLGTEPTDGDHVRVADGTGQLYDSRDGGRTWQAIGVPGFPPSEIQSVHTAVFDPADLDHVVQGGSDTGARVTFDGGRTWAASTGLSKTGTEINVFSVAISPVSSDIVYVMGLNAAESEAGALSDGRHIYKSIDGGRHFDPVVDQGNGTWLPNGALLVAHPTDPGVLYFEYGTWWEGTYIYRYDSAQNQVTTTHNPYDGVTSIAFNPLKPQLMYLGVAEEA